MVNKYKIKRNKFGILSKYYDSARRGYPDEVFTYLKKIMKDKELKVLDIGCGTGISTRQLKKHKFNVIGVDKENKMIRVAKGKKDNIPYVVASIDKLPFKDGEFDIITAFTAFHWFTDKKSVTEIKRVLKPDGLFFAALKKTAKPKSKRIKKLSSGQKRILTKYLKKNANSARDYKPEKTFRKYGFVKINGKSFYITEKYSLNEALTLIKSTSSWNLLSGNLRSKFYGELESLYRKNLINGFVIRNREVKVVYGFKPKQ